MKKQWTLFIAVVALGLSACQAPNQDELVDRTADKVRGELKDELKAEIKAEIMAELEAEIAALSRAKGQVELGSGDPNQPVAKPDPKPDPTQPVAKPDPNQPVAKPDPNQPDPNQPVAKPDPEPMPAPPTLVEDSQGLSITQHVIAAKIQNRLPAGISDHFDTSTEKVVCFVEANNAKGPERTLTAAWIYEGQEVHRFELQVGKSKTWRTWARAKIRPKKLGAWRCDILDEEGKVLSSAPYTVSE